MLIGQYLPQQACLKVSICKLLGKVKLERACERAINVLLELIETKDCLHSLSYCNESVRHACHDVSASQVNYVVQEACVVVKDPASQVR